MSQLQTDGLLLYWGCWCWNVNNMCNVEWHRDTGGSGEQRAEAECTQRTQSNARLCLLFKWQSCHSHSFILSTKINCSFIFAALLIILDKSIEYFRAKLTKSTSHNLLHFLPSRTVKYNFFSKEDKRILGLRMKNPCLKCALLHFNLISIRRRPPNASLCQFTSASSLGIGETQITDTIGLFLKSNYVNSDYFRIVELHFQTNGRSLLTFTNKLGFLDYKGGVFLVIPISWILDEFYFELFETAVHFLLLGRYDLCF